MLQLITYDESTIKEFNNKLKISNFTNHSDFNDFDINIIDLSHQGLWDSYSPTGWDSIKNIVNLTPKLRILENSIHNCETKTVIILPQNLEFKHNYRGKNITYTPLNEMIPSFKDVLSDLYGKISGLKVNFANTITTINEKEFQSNFAFSDSLKFESILCSDNGKTITTVKNDEVILTTLNLKGIDDYYVFLTNIGLLIEKDEDMPEWMGRIEMFDDSKQQETIFLNQQQIIDCERIIHTSEEIIEKNKHFKSILYTQGDKLVDVVSEVLSLIFECNLSEFEDKKKEDFAFLAEEKIFIGEIKGISSNVKTTNLSQLDNHFTSFVEDHPEIDAGNIYKILIINHQRTKPLDERDPVDKTQIKAAETKYQSLIVETFTLLKMFERFKNEGLIMEDCIQMFTQTGILQEDDLKIKS